MISSVSWAFDFSSVRLFGWWEKNEEFIRTSSPGVKISVSFFGDSLFFDAEGKAFWEVFIDGKPKGKILTGSRSKILIAKTADKKNHLAEIVLASELLPGEVKIFGFFAQGKNSSGKILPPPKAPSRRIEFIGDSFTVGYGVEAKNPEDGTVFEKTNTTKSYAYRVASELNADYRISAFSGRGLVRNYDNLEPDWTIPKLLKQTVPGITASSLGGKPRDFSEWHPQVIVLFVGINDFQGAPPRAREADFVSAYRTLLAELRQSHPGVKFLLLSTKVWPEDLLIPALESVCALERSAGQNDFECKVLESENTALHGHPSESSQEKMAKAILSSVASLGGFSNR